MEPKTAAFGYLRERLCSKEPLGIRDMRHVVNGERRSRASKVLIGAFVPWLLIVTPFGRKGEQLERRADALRNFRAEYRVIGPRVRKLTRE